MPARAMPRPARPARPAARMLGARAGLLASVIATAQPAPRRSTPTPEPTPPAAFDSRVAWPQCPSIAAVEATLACSQPNGCGGGNRSSFLPTSGYAAAATSRRLGARARARPPTLACASSWPAVTAALVVLCRARAPVQAWSFRCGACPRPAARPGLASRLTAGRAAGPRRSHAGGSNALGWDYFHTHGIPSAACQPYTVPTCTGPKACVVNPRDPAAPASTRLGVAPD